jgi:uroporphyrinogen-III synthase
MSLLGGKTIAITGQRRAEEMAEMGRRLRGRPYVATTVNLHFEEAIEEAERLVTSILDGVDFAVFYTGVGVRAIFNAAEKMGELDSLRKQLESAEVHSRGRKSLRALREKNRQPDHEANPATTVGVIKSLLQSELSGKRVLVQTPGPMPNNLQDAITGAGADLIHGSPYRFLPPEDPEKVIGLIRDLIEAKIDAITFTSPPAVNNLFLAADDLSQADDLTRALNERVFTASVGPVTSGAIRDHGVDPGLESESQRMGNLLQELAQVISSETVPSGKNPSPNNQDRSDS